MGDDEFEIGEGIGNAPGAQGVGNLVGGIGHVVAGVEDGDQAAGGEALVEREHAGIVEDEFLVVGVELDALEAFIGGFVGVDKGVGIVGMDGEEHLDAGLGGADGAGPAADAVEVRGLGGDGANNGTINARAVHVGQKRGNAAVEEGLDVAFLLQERDGLGGQVVFKGVGVEVDEHGGIESEFRNP